jgi:reverse gyrase
MDISKLTLSSHEDDERLNTLIPEELCPECGGNITVGEYQCSGMCTDCYFNAISINDYE